MNTTKVITLSGLLLVAACGSKNNGTTPKGDMAGNNPNEDMTGQDMTGQQSNDDLSGTSPQDMTGTLPSGDLLGLDLTGLSAGCSANADYKVLGKIIGQADSSTDATSGDVSLTWSGPLNSDTAPDAVSVELYGEAGAFANNPKLKTGSFDITGDELNYATCGVCVLIYTDLTMMNGSTYYKDAYMATGGKVNITSISGKFTATVTGATFEHVDIDPNTYQSTPINDGCNSAFTSLNYDDTITAAARPMAPRRSQTATK